MGKISKKLLIGIVVLIILAGVGVFAATNYGSESDPLITKSYLDKVVRPELETELKHQIDTAKAQVLNSVPGEFSELSLSAGQKVLCGEGCQVLICSGTANSIGTLTDTTAGGVVNPGTSISLYHLCIASESGCGFSAGSSGAKALLSGSYSMS